jgi:hypothetical protein
MVFLSCSTFRKDYSAELKLRVSDDGLTLVVISFSDHPIRRVKILNPLNSLSLSLSHMQELFKQLPQQRRLESQIDQQEAENLLSLKANKKMVQDKLVKSTD